jgi:hypothetical protein
MITSPRAYAGRSPALAAGVAAAGLALLGAVAAAGSPGRALLLLLAGLAAGIGAAILANWRLGVYLLLAWLVVEDLPRKFLGNDMRVYFAKDALAAAVYVAFLAARVRSGEPRPRVGFLGPLLAFVGWGLVQVFNPESPSLVYGLLGLRMYFFYIPLLFVGYAFLRDERDLRRFLAFNLVAATIIAGLGIVQGIVGLDFLNPAQLAPELNLAHLVRQAPITGALVPRATSVFASDARFAWYMLVMFLLGAGTVAYLVSRRARGAGMAAAAVATVAAAIALSGSRGTFVYALGSAGVLAGAFAYGAGPRLRRWIGRALALGLAAAGVVLVAVVVLYPEAVGARWAFYSETIAPWSPTSELGWRVWGYPIGNLLGAFSFPGWPLGYGIGTSSLGVQYVTGLLGLPAPGIGVESGYGTLILELGIVGPLLWLLWTVALVREGWRTVRRLRGTPVFPIGFAILWFLLLLLFPFTFGGMQPYQNYVLNAYLWLLAGVLFRLPAMTRALQRR